jgi:hypothetical protein
MSPPTLMIAVDWYGPFRSLKAARLECERTNVGECLYLAIFDQEQGSYIGISSSILSRLNSGHHVLGAIENGGADVWIGIVSSQAIPGRRAVGGYVSHSEPVHVAEHLIAYLLELDFNRSKRKSPPKQTAIVFNRWFEPEHPYDRRSARGHKDWPDILEFDAESETAKLVHFDGKCRSLNSQQIWNMRRTD